MTGVLEKECEAYSNAAGDVIGLYLLCNWTRDGRVARPRPEAAVWFH
jgi:hypothetical protein